MVGQEKSDRYRRRLKLLSIAITLLIILSMLALAAFFSYIFAYLGSIDDPFSPRLPDYDYRLSVTGLEGFTTDDGSAVIRMPLPGADGKPLLTEGWWVNYPNDSNQHYHGMQSLRAVNTSEGPMLEARIITTDYYESYARATPIAVSPGQNTSGLPGVVPDRINKTPSFDDVHVIASGYVEPLNYPTGAQGRTAVKKFLNTPLLPVAYVPELCTLETNYSTYVYVDPALRPLSNDSTLKVEGKMIVKLNHNKVNASEEGVRRFEIHTYTIDETIPGGVTGYVPVEVRYQYSVGV
ncbi:hypothetical protein [Methanocella sp. MCL-LM]|uniref:hypothetical protein n=1 Tax=Methanocella sp. MCL-LM TaxID=3412035 RepID=UPI003C741FE9